MLPFPPKIQRPTRVWALTVGLGLLVVGTVFSESPSWERSTSSSEVELLSRRISEKSLSPRSFSHFFSKFGFEFNTRVQPPRTFLTRRQGDCDDYAVLADAILPHHGYKTRLIQVRLAGKTDHAVCYVEGDRIYLDYNNRDYFFTLTKSKPSLAAVADKVAESLRGHWTSASEFEYCYQAERKTFTATVAKLKK